MRNKITSALTRSIDGLSKAGRVNLRSLMHKRLGILQYTNSRESGELLFVFKILPSLLSDTKTPILFDVGLNEGNYSSYLLEVFPEARLFAFEPVASNFERARERLTNSRALTLENKAVSDSAGHIEIYDYADRDGSSHASPYKEAITEQHGAEEVISYHVGCVTLDQYCAERNIDRIDFIKVDTEGHELSVLNGAKNLIRKHQVKIVQFEFNEMNVLSKSFLRDFYILLEDFHFYRLRFDGLIPLGEYNTINEIFKFQNIVAVSSPISINANRFAIKNIWG